MAGKIYPVCLFLLLLFVAGCWDVEEIPRRGIANAVFFDMGRDGGIKMWVAVTVPGSQVPPNVGTFQQFAKRTFNVTGEGNSTVDAWAKIQATSERDIFFGQTRAIVLSEKVSRRNLNDILEFIGRIPLVPPNTNVLVTKADPDKLLDLQVKNNDPPGIYIDYFFRSPFKRSLAIPIDLWRVNALFDKKTGDPYLPIIDASQQMYIIAGTALFSRTHFVAELNLDETQTLALIKGTDVGYQTIPLGKKKYIAFKNIRSHTKITPKESPDGTLIFEIRSNIQGVLIENIPHRDIQMRQKRAIETRAKKLFQEKITRLLSKLQSLNSDPVQFGEKYRIAHPRLWRQIDWHQVYAAAKFKVNTNFSVKETGIFR